jgi:hypothetical protein
MGGVFYLGRPIVREIRFNGKANMAVRLRIHIEKSEFLGTKEMIDEQQDGLALVERINMSQILNNDIRKASHHVLWKQIRDSGVDEGGV